MNSDMNVDASVAPEIGPTLETSAADGQQEVMSSDMDIEAPTSTVPAKRPVPEPSAIQTPKKSIQQPTITEEMDVDAPASAVPETNPVAEASSSEAYPLIMEAIPDHEDVTDMSEASREAMDKFLHFIHEYTPDPSTTESLEEQVQKSLEDLIIRHAKMSGSYKGTFNMAKATEKQKAAERRRILNAPETKHRFVFQSWPRDPKGARMIQDGPERQGKQTTNGNEIWGATLYDFYTVHRMPELPSLVTLSSGSRLAAWMKLHGESYAVGALQAAAEEAEPQLILPCDVGQVIQDIEGIPWPPKSWARSHDMYKKGKGRPREDWELPDNWPPESPFDPRAYPSPWPQAPFTYDQLAKPPNLQAYIPATRLPAKLVVHDPGKLLNVSGRRRAKELAPDAEDITHIYTLKRSTRHTARADGDEAELQTQEATRKRVREEFLKSPSSNKTMPSGIIVDDGTRTLGPCKPPIYIVFPHLPERPQPAEAHLYLSPSAELGVGNHSYVFRAELELPRSFLVDEVMCPECVFDDLRQILDEQDGPRGERRDRRWDFKSGRHEFKTKTRTGATVMLKDENGVEKERLARAPEEQPDVVYEGPYRAIETRVKFQDLALGPYCEHLRKKLIHPLTAKVCVAAKLSIDGDAHLAREAENYQAFPRHLFEHWSGYNIIYPLHDPVPVTPVVPQFYGYYVVDRDASKASELDDKGKQKETSPSGSEDTGKGKEKEKEEYLSPILLLEDCGRAIDPDKLSIDDKQECAGLLYRFHEANWLHNSVARRNIVRQPGPLSAFPMEKVNNTIKRGGLGTDWSYRLIDFGRSCLVESLPSSNLSVVSERSIMQNWLSKDVELP